ncbi:MAG: single-stranded DNA-binding protein [Clostridiales bacterium]|jgi:single-strand DNA-binding protein|nr:single-stranded DNA-binding protein [Clostridiales bacterium]
MLNRAILMGRLIRDPELKTTQSGFAFCKFCIAVDRDFSNSDSEKKTDFIYVVSWRRNAEFISKYFFKGSMIIVVGSLQTRNWDGQDGIKRYVFEVIADQVYFGDSKKANSQYINHSDSNFESEKSNDFGSDYMQSKLGNPSVEEESDDFSMDDSDDDLPF